MAGSVVDRLASRPAATRRAVLLALVAGLSFGAMACAAGLAAGHAHATTAPRPSPDLHHDSDDHGPDRGGAVALGDAHPGMACVVSVDLRYPESAVTTITDRCVPVDATANAGWSPEVDPPVPRSS